MEGKVRKIIGWLAGVMLAGSVLCACGSRNEDSTADSVIGSGNDVIRILSGSENKELEPILEDYAKEKKCRIEMTYKGSLEIAGTLEQDQIDYDAVWPASSLWISYGDVNHKVKHQESISVTPVVFGIRKSLAEELGFTGKEVSIRDILSAIQAGKLHFCMTSATQSNSGCCAYIGFLYALLNCPDVITSDMLEDETLKENVKTLLSGVDRSSGSSDWLKEMYLNHSDDYDAMVNYECLIIQADEELEKEGKEPLYAVYPYDGLSLADSPLGYVDQGDEDEEKLFLDLQDYLLSDDVQDEIQKEGRRTGYEGVSEKNRSVFNEDWGIQPDRVLSPFQMPEKDVIDEALNLYQTELRKPSLTVYCLDYSGSMHGEGNQQLEEAMKEILVQSEAAKNFLQASENEVNIVIPFDDQVMSVWTAEGNGSEIEQLYENVTAMEPDGGTDMYEAMEQGLQELQSYDLSAYTPAIIVMSDGRSRGNQNRFFADYEDMDMNVPVFSIMFGDADETQLDALAEKTGGRVFDGREDLTGAFRAVKGYN